MALILTKSNVKMGALSRSPIAGLFDGLTDWLENLTGKLGSGSEESDDTVRF